MDHTDLGVLAREQAEAAAGASSGRAAVTVFGGHANTLRQTVIALNAGAELREHESPGEATLQVLSGHVRIEGSSGESAEARTGGLLSIPAERHNLEAVEASVVLLTVAKT